jgi:hypothetical protein
MSRIRLPRFTDRLALGTRGLSVSPFCVGIVTQPATVLAAFDAGINFFFVTADMHWPLYEPLRRGLAQLFARGNGIREQVVVAGVSYATQPEFCSMPYQELIANVPKLQDIDVLCAGGAYGHEIASRLEVYQHHLEHSFAGARAIAVSFHDRGAVSDLANGGAVDLCLVRYNAAHPKARSDLFPHIRSRRARVYNFKNVVGHVASDRCTSLGLALDAWRPEVTDHYRFVLSEPELDGLLCAPSTPEQIESLGRALEEGPLEADERQYLVQLYKLAHGAARLG